MIIKSNDERAQGRIIDIENLMPKEHILRKIDKVFDFEKIYQITGKYYCEDNGRPCTDPVILVKIAIIQHIFGIRSLRQTMREIEVNIAYRWFLHYNIDTPIPHFATVSYAFAKRFPSEVFTEIFAMILEIAVQKKLVKAENIFIDSTHVKANANKKKNHKILSEETARFYDEKLREEINLDRQNHNKKPLKEREKEPELKQITVSDTDPECGLFHKGEHEKQFAYTVHTACDEHNFILNCEVTPANIHDSKVFDKVFEKVCDEFSEVETIAVDAGYKTPAICKIIVDKGKNPCMPYKRPMTKPGFFKKYDFVYDEFYDCVICPENQILKYGVTNKNGYKEFKSDPKICVNCPKKSGCTENKNSQKTFVRHIWEDFIELAEDFRHTMHGKEIYAKRSQTIERVFADAKEKHAMRYTPYRGLTRVTNWG